MQEIYVHPFLKSVQAEVASVMLVFALFTQLQEPRLTERCFTPGAHTTSLIIHGPAKVCLSQPPLMHSLRLAEWRGG